MWENLTKEENNRILLSLFPFHDKKSDASHLRFLYTLSNRVEDNYYIFSVPKKNGKKRVIYAPNETLKKLQRDILDSLLKDRRISSYAKAYQQGLSLKDNVSPHLKKKYILKLDIKEFFEHITFSKVLEKAFPLELFPRNIGILLTKLCTYDGHLPQGAPTSAFLSNLVMRDFDEEIGAFCEKRNISYTRYSDDMTFSGDFDPKEVIKEVEKNLLPLYLRLNKKKSKWIPCSQRQVVTGIVVNQKMQISSTYRKKIRQEIYFIKKYGLANHLERLGILEEKDRYLHSLYGRILFVLQINPFDQEFLQYRSFFESTILKR